MREIGNKTGIARPNSRLKAPDIGPLLTNCTEAGDDSVSGNHDGRGRPPVLSVPGPAQNPQPMSVGVIDYGGRFRGPSAVTVRSHGENRLHGLAQLGSNVI